VTRIDLLWSLLQAEDRLVRTSATSQLVRIRQETVPPAL
jgi:hypothetical protein